MKGYSAQYGFDPGSLPKSISKMSEIDVYYIESLSGSNGKPVYPRIRQVMQAMQKVKKNNRKSKKKKN